MILGVGLEAGTPVAHVHDLLARLGVDLATATVIATVDTRADEPALRALAEGRELRTYPAAALDAVDVPHPSAVVRRLAGTRSVAEAAALLAAGPGGALVVEKAKGAGVTVAVARARRNDAPMTDESRIGAPSPADGPTTPGATAVSRDAASDGAQAPPPIDRPTIPDGAAARRPRARVSPGRTKIGGAWVGLILGAVLLVFLLVFILQNLVPAEVTFLGLRGTLPLGIWLLFAAIAGVLLLAIPGLGRMVQWRKAARGKGRVRP